MHIGGKTIIIKLGYSVADAVVSNLLVGANISKYSESRVLVLYMYDERQAISTKWVHPKMYFVVIIDNVYKVPCPIILRYTLSQTSMNNCKLVLVDSWCPPETPEILTSQLGYLSNITDTYPAWVCTLLTHYVRDITVSRTHGSNHKSVVGYWSKRLVIFLLTWCIIHEATMIIWADSLINLPNRYSILTRFLSVLAAWLDDADMWWIPLIRSLNKEADLCERCIASHHLRVCSL